MTTEKSTDKLASPLLEWLLRKHPETPKKRAKQWIMAGRVSVNGVIIRQPNQSIPDPGDALELLDRRVTAVVFEPAWEIHTRVGLLYLDSSLAIVNKGPGLLSVPAPKNDLCALSILADFLVGKLKARERGIAGRTLPPAFRKLRPMPVHRLDQYTSGLLCIALNPTARMRLIEQLQARTMKREYVAYVDGRATLPKGTWRHWVELSEDETRQHIVPERQAKADGSKAVEAITHYEVIKEFPLAAGKGFITKLRLRLETGRRHQIRVQAAQERLPLIGDHTYNPDYRGYAPSAARIEFSRQALHAERLSLEHPEQAGKQMTWTAALPKDLLQLEATLRSGRVSG